MDMPDLAEIFAHLQQLDHTTLSRVRGEIDRMLLEKLREIRERVVAAGSAKVA
jgi:hypothetical protein